MRAGLGQIVDVQELAPRRAAAPDDVFAVVGFTGRIVFDASKPDGTPRKLLDVSRLAALGWRASTPLREGIALAYRDFQRRYDIISRAGA